MSVSIWEPVHLIPLQILEQGLILSHAAEAGGGDGEVGLGGGKDHALALDKADAPKVPQGEGPIAHGEPVPVEGHGPGGERRQTVVVLLPVQGLVRVREGGLLAQGLGQLLHLLFLPLVPVQGRRKGQVVPLEEAIFIQGHGEAAVAVEPVPVAVERVDPVASGAEVQGGLQRLSQGLALEGHGLFGLGLVSVFVQVPLEERQYLPLAHLLERLRRIDPHGRAGHAPLAPMGAPARRGQIPAREPIGDEGALRQLHQLGGGGGDGQGLPGEGAAALGEHAHVPPLPEGAQNLQRRFRVGGALHPLDDGGVAGDDLRQEPHAHHVLPGHVVHVLGEAQAHQDGIEVRHVVAQNEAGPLRLRPGLRRIVQQPFHQPPRRFEQRPVRPPLPLIGPFVLRHVVLLNRLF